MPHSAIAACVKPPDFHKFAVAHRLAPLEQSKRCRAAVSCSAALHNRQPTDPVNLAPAGQDCRHLPLRCGVRRLASTSALPRMLSHPAAPPARRWHPSEPAAPADCPLPPAADKRLPPLIVLRCVVMMFLPVIYVEAIVNHSENINPFLVVSVIVLLLYRKSRLIRCRVP